MISGLIFYLFAFLTIIFAIMTVSMRNPVHSVLSLIMVFFNVAALFIMIGAEFLAATLVIVYVGAVAVLFLFVVMMLDIKIEHLRKGFSKNLPFALMICVVLIIDLTLTTLSSFTQASKSNLYNVPALPPAMTNTHQIGSVLYTDYVLPFQLSGVILLVAMIGSILLTLRSRDMVKKQDINLQNERNRESSIKIIKVETGAGVDVIN